MTHLGHRAIAALHMQKMATEHTGQWSSGGNERQSGHMQASNEIPPS